MLALSVLHPPGASEAAPAGSQEAFAPARGRGRVAAGLWLVALLAIAELVVRTWIQSPSPRPNPPRLWVDRQPFSRIVQSIEGYNVSRVNSLGLVDDEPRVPRAPIVALVMGDSYAEALQVARAENFSNVAERSLPELDVINLGRAACYPVNYAFELPRMYARYRPDWVVVQVNDGDVRELLDPALFARVRAEIQNFARDSVALSAPVPWPTAFSRFLVRESALAYFAKFRLALLADKERARLAKKLLGGRRGEYLESLSGPVDPHAGVLLDSLYREMTRVTPRILFVYIPDVDYFSRPPAPGFPDRRAFFHAFAARTGATLIDPTDALLADFARTRQPLHGFQNSILGLGHINARGHRIVGELLARAIREGGR